MLEILAKNLSYLVQIRHSQDLCIKLGNELIAERQKLIEANKEILRLKQQYEYRVGSGNMARALGLIAHFIGMDIDELKDYRYHYGHTSCPVYSVGQDYYCCPPSGGKLPEGFGKWERVTICAFEGRAIYKATAESE